ncbi:MAG: radical SAM protein, partial [Thermodesulfobacteriota bacterium]
DQFTDLKESPLPGRSVLSMERYFSDIVQTTKGCPFNCEFCSVYAFDGQRIRTKTVEQVIEEIINVGDSSAKYKKRSVFFADDNIIANKKFARQLFTALKPYNVNWACQASVNIAEEDELLGLMKDSGCGSILIGLETTSKENLGRMDKSINLRHDYVDAIKKIQSYGILVHGSFILGYDFDDAAAFDDLIAFVDSSQLLMPLINILTPFPGTKLFDRFEEEGRLIHKDWNKYTGQEVVFYPSRMTPEALHEGFKKVVQHIYSYDSIYKKLQHYWKSDFWRHSNEIDPIKFKYRLLFAARLSSLMVSFDTKRTKFILKILPKVFNKRVRLSTILTLMAYNDFAYSL